MIPKKIDPSVTPIPFRTDSTAQRLKSLQSEISPSNRQLNPETPSGSPRPTVMAECYTITTTSSSEGASSSIVVSSEESPEKNLTIEVVEHTCSRCGKTYKGLRCLQKHLLICGQPKPKKKPQKRKSDEELTPEKPAKTKEAVKVKEKSPETENPDEAPEEDEGPIIEVLPIDDLDTTPEVKDPLCYCCEEPLKNAHTGHVRCNFCKRKFHTYMGRDKHLINLHNSSEAFKCAKCKTQCVSAEILQVHLSMHSEFVCENCGAEFSRRYHLERHMTLSNCGGDLEKDAHKCEVCGKKFLRLDNLRVHLKRHISDEGVRKDVVCPVCEKAFPGQSMLTIHLRTHTGERPFPCDLCTKAFPSNGALLKHRRVHTGEKPFECSYCHLRFAAKETLNRHVKTHTGNKSYKCEECGVAFIQKTQLRNHMFHHTGKDGVQCPHCEERCDNKATLHRHIATLHNIKWSCKDCPMTFGLEADLKRHETTMHGSNKRFICENCLVEFRKKAELLEHITQCIGPQMGQPTLSCKECGKVYKRHDLLAKHERFGHLPVPIVSPKKRGRPRKVRPEEETLIEVIKVEELEGDKEKEGNDQIFNQLKNSLDAAEFTENCPLKPSTVSYRTEKALTGVFEKILTGLLDQALLKKIGWPKTGVIAALDKVLNVIGVDTSGGKKKKEEQDEEEEEEDTMTGMKNKMMALLGKFIGEDSLGSMMNNYSVDQVLQYLADSVSK